jgi:hypothetical protein
VTTKVKDNLEEASKKYWRPIAAYVYLAICVFDFIGMPLFFELNRRPVNTEAIEAIASFKDKDVQVAAIEALPLQQKEWTPLTLEGAGMFHIAFGAILGVAAWTRGREKVAALERMGANGINFDDCDEEDDEHRPRRRR